jgi:hypothetical protein
MTDEGNNIVELPPEVSGAYLDPPPPPSRHRGSHGWLIGAALGSFIVAVLSMLAFVTVGWPGDSGRILVGIFLFSILVFLASAAAAVFTAARATHARPRSTRTP